jgi:hypothetical protein
MESTWAYWKLLRWEELKDNDIYCAELSSEERFWFFYATDGKSLLFYREVNVKYFYVMILVLQILKLLT